MKRVILLLFSLFATLSYTQTYTYSFKGELDESKISAYEQECLKFNKVVQVKIKYKPEKKMGEFIIKTSSQKEGERKEGDVLFQPVDIKQFLMDKNLQPLNFRLLKD